MRKITSELVERVKKHVESLPAAETPLLVQALSEEQPLIYSYLMTFGKEEFNDGERKLVMDVALAVWQIMRHEAGSLPAVRQATLDRAEERNRAMLRYLESEPESDFEHTVKLIFQSYNQSEVLRYVLNAIMGSGKGTIRDETKGTMLYTLKNVIDCFDAEHAA